MTTQEFNLNFDIQYNNIAGQSNPSLDIFEKSIYLTRAQLEIVKNYYDPDSNRKKRGFEGSEKRRNDLKQLVKDYKNNTSITSNVAIHNTSRFFTIPQDVFVIVNEKVKIISEDCTNGTVIEVVPITHDEFNTQIKNPFQNPNEDLAWRLDISNISTNKVVEIISPYNITGSLEYQMRYIKYPKPIILGNLATIYPSETLTIDGLSALTNCELDIEIHSEILDRAVELAILDYKPQNLQAKIQLDTRNE